MILATCDSAREREANKEIVNLVDMVIEEWKASGRLKGEKLDQADSPADADKEEVSMADLLAAEIAEVRGAAKEGASQNARIINTNVKGMALVKIVQTDNCPVDIVRHIFKTVKLEKKAYSRHIVRLIPLKFCFFPDEWDLVDNARDAIIDRFPGIQLPMKFYTMTKEEKEKIQLAKQIEKEKKKAERVQRRKEEEAKLIDDAIKDGNINEDNNNGEAQSGQKRSAEDLPVVQPGNAPGEEVPSTAKAARTEQRPLAPSTGEQLEKKGEVKQQTKEASSYGATAVAYPPFRYDVRFKGRNHNTLTKQLVAQYITNNFPAPPMAALTRADPDVSTPLSMPLLFITYPQHTKSSFSWGCSCAHALRWRDPQINAATTIARIKAPLLGSRYLAGLSV